jgi:hypothetical protein
MILQVLTVVSMKMAVFWAVFPLIFVVSVWRKFHMSKRMALNVRQTADFILSMQVTISAKINVYCIRDFLLFYSFMFVNIVSNEMLYYCLL